MTEMRAPKLRLVRAGAAVSEAASAADALLVKAGRGDEQAFALLYDEVSAMVFGVIRRVVRDPALAAEVSQEVFVEVWRLAPRFDASRGSAHSWVATIAHRRAVDRVRSEQARRDREDADHTSNTRREFDEVAAEVTAAQEHEDVKEALDSLTEAQREAVTLAYYGGHTYREVARMLDVPEGTIKTRIRDGLIRLRDKMGPLS